MGFSGVTFKANKANKANNARKLVYFLFSTSFFLVFTCKDLYGFVHVSRFKPTLPSTRAAPEILFYWDGTVPRIKDKHDFEGGAYQNLPDNEFFTTLMQLSFDKWNTVEGSYLVMTPTLDTEAVIDNQDLRNSIVVSNISSLSAAAYAQPMNISTKKESEQSAHEKNKAIIHDCDITISDQEVNAKDLFSIMIHEIGHCVGLGHPHTNYSSIMSYARPQGSTSLGLDDMAGIIYLYPEEDVSVKELVSCGRLGGHKKHSRAGAVNIGGFLLLLPLCSFFSLFFLSRKSKST